MNNFLIGFFCCDEIKILCFSLLFYYLRKVINKYNKNKITHRLHDSMIFFDQLKAVEQRSWLNRRMLSFTIFCDTFQMYCLSCCLGILFQHPASQQYDFINSFSQTRWKLLKGTFLGHWWALSAAYNTIFRVFPQTSGFFGCLTRTSLLCSYTPTAVFMSLWKCEWQFQTDPSVEKKQTVKSTVFIG